MKTRTALSSRDIFLSFAALWSSTSILTIDGFSLPCQSHRYPLANGYIKSANSIVYSQFSKRDVSPFERAATRLTAQPDDSLDEGNTIFISTPTGYFLGVVGTIAALVTFYSEFTLKTTGCGLPAGPFGLFGLVEGLSYLCVTGIAAYSTVTKVKTGSGLPAGPWGLVGAAEGLSFLAIAVGLVVLALQVLDYGYIPNAVPMEGGMCS